MELKEDEDFYFNEDGLMVFTANYHLKRGSCCKSGCMHCPWKYRKRNSEKDPINNENRPIHI